MKIVLRSVSVTACLLISENGAQLTWDVSLPPPALCDAVRGSEVVSGVEVGREIESIEGCERGKRRDGRRRVCETEVSA